MPTICRITFRGDMKSCREHYEWQQQRNETSRSPTRIKHRPVRLAEWAWCTKYQSFLSSWIFTSVSVGSSPRLLLLETFRFKDKDDYEYEIWLFTYSQNIDSPESFILPVFSIKVNTATLNEGGYTLSWSQKDKTTFDNLFPPLWHSR